MWRVWQLWHGLQRLWYAKFPLTIALIIGMIIGAIVKSCAGN